MKYLILLFFCLLVCRPCYPATHYSGFSIRDISCFYGFNMPRNSHPEQMLELCYERLNNHENYNSLFQKHYKAVAISFINNPIDKYQAIGARFSISPYCLPVTKKFWIFSLVNLRTSYGIQDKFLFQPELGLYLRHAFYKPPLVIKLNINYGIRMMQNSPETIRCPSVLVGIGWKI